MKNKSLNLISNDIYCFKSESTKETSPQVLKIVALTNLYIPNISLFNNIIEQFYALQSCSYMFQVIS